jgi:flagellar hook-associated protein 2
MAGIQLSGLASGMDWQSLVTQIIQADRAPETQMQTEKSTIQQQKTAYTNIQTQLNTLQTKLQTLTDPSLFDSRTSQVDDSTVASATAAAGATQGSYVFNFTQLATAASLQGSTNIGKSLNSTNDVSGLVLSGAGFASPVTAGAFTVNGNQVTLATTDTLQSVFDKINTATGGAVTGSYDATSDTISLTSANEIVLGSATDTSNFLQIAKLYNNGSGEVTSSAALGAVSLVGPMANANFATTISDGGSGNGQFTINGVSISYSATGNSIQNVIDQINNSAAGVIASYDTVNDRLVLTNRSTGDTGIALQDVTGNFLAATGLTGGTLQRGKNLLYSVNGGPQLVSQSNTLTADSSGVTGLSVTALKQASTTVTVGSDTAKIKTSIQDFVTEYNNTQNLIDSQTASTTDSQGKVTAGILTGDTVAEEITSKLRSLAYSPLPNGTNGISTLADLGIDSNGQDNTLSITDSTKLDDALANNLQSVKQLFSDTTNGLAVNLNTYVTATTGDSGTLATEQDTLTKQSADIDQQISDLESRLSDEQQRLTTEFVNMETAQAQTNQQMQYLQQRFGTSSTG